MTRRPLEAVISVLQFQVGVTDTAEEQSNGSKSSGTPRFRCVAYLDRPSSRWTAINGRSLFAISTNTTNSAARRVRRGCELARWRRRMYQAHRGPVSSPCGHIDSLYRVRGSQPASCSTVSMPRRRKSRSIAGPMPLRSASVPHTHTIK